MRRHWIFAFFLAAALAAALHRLYGWLPLPVVGLFAPVRASAWEQLKLLFWPFLLAGSLLTRGQADKHNAWSGVLASALLQPLLFLAARYTLWGALGLQAAVLDGALLLLTLAAGCRLATELGETGAATPSIGLLVVLAALYAACLVLFSLAIPHLPLFLFTPARFSGLGRAF